MSSLAALALAALAAVPVGDAAKRAPVRVDADEVHYAFQKREVIFIGKDTKPVTMTRDDAKLTCQKLVARQDAAGQIVSAACQGDVRLTRGAKVVTCDHATFENAEERVICEGNTVLRDGGSEARGTKLVYELKTDAANLEGATVTLPGEEIDQKQKALEERRKKGAAR